MWMCPLQSLYWLGGEVLVVVVVASRWAVGFPTPSALENHFMVSPGSHQGFLGMCSGTDKPGSFESLIKPAPSHPTLWQVTGGSGSAPPCPTQGSHISPGSCGCFLQGARSWWRGSPSPSQAFQPRRAIIPSSCQSGLSILGGKRIWGRPRETKG